MKLISLTLFILFFTNIIYAADLQTNTANTQATIQTIQDDLTQQRNLRTQLQQNLQQVDTQLTDATQQYQKITADQKAQLANLKKLQKQQQIYEKKLAAQHTLLNQQLIAIYKLQGTQAYSTGNNRYSDYFGYYVIQHQLDQVDELTDSIQQVVAEKDAIQEQQQQLAVLKQQQNQQLANIKSKQAAHQKSLDQVIAAIQTKDETLGQLLADNTAVDKVVQQVTNTNANANTNVSDPAATQPVQIIPSNTEPFASLKGKLHWPIQGHIVADFNTHISESGAKLPGVLIGASVGQNVYAIAPGKVVFADSMSGYGLLMIIDHGQGYMTLYGRNSNLYKQVGDAIHVGERIASVGVVDNAAAPSLYFAIRKNGSPLNPQAWCKG